MFTQFVSPGDAAQDSMFTAAGFFPAFVAHVETALIIGLVNALIVVVFRGVELWLKYGRKGKAPNDSNSPGQGDAGAAAD